jgi:hypothetical protein
MTLPRLRLYRLDAQMRYRAAQPLTDATVWVYIRTKYLDRFEQLGYGLPNPFRARVDQVAVNITGLDFRPMAVLAVADRPPLYVSLAQIAWFAEVPSS